jgi:hypothetical protein
MEIVKMYVKFNSENKSEICYLNPIEGTNIEGFETCADSLMGFRLIKANGTIRAMTEEELAAERTELARARESSSAT